MSWAISNRSTYSNYIYYRVLWNRNPQPPPKKKKNTKMTQFSNRQFCPRIFGNVPKTSWLDKYQMSLGILHQTLKKVPSKWRLHPHLYIYISCMDTAYGYGTLPTPQKSRKFGDQETLLVNPGSWMRHISHCINVTWNPFMGPLVLALEKNGLVLGGLGPFKYWGHLGSRYI